AEATHPLARAAWAAMDDAHGGRAGQLDAQAEGQRLQPAQLLRRQFGGGQADWCHPAGLPVGWAVLAAGERGEPRSMVAADAGEAIGRQALQHGATLWPAVDEVASDDDAIRPDAL